MKNALYACLVACIFVLQGCASSSAIVVGKARPEVAPETVKLYLTPPAKFEEVALLEASSYMSMAFTDQSKMDAVIGKMKIDAAKLGANGIIIRSTGNTSGAYSGTMIGSGNSAFFAGGSTTYKNGTGVAIFVIAE